MTARPRPRVLPYCFALALLGLGGCAQELSTGPEAADVRTAKGGSGKGGGGGGGGGGGSDDGAPDPTVESTDPSSASQGTTLDVRVFGTSFDPGSSVAILLELKSTSKVTTNSTTFVSDTALIANITVAEDAEIDLYDVQVTTARGKKGVGIELLAITAPPIDLASRPADPAPAGLYEDGQGLYLGAFGVTNGGQGNGNYAAIPDCAEGRSMDLVLPAAWAIGVGVSVCDWTTGSRKQDDGQRVRLHIPGLLFRDCPDGIRCDIGEPPEGTNFSPSLHYYLHSDTDGDGTFAERGEPAYDVVWTDGTFAVLERADDGSPCVFHVTGTTADLWENTVPSSWPRESVAFDATVTRIDGPCTF